MNKNILRIIFGMCLLIMLLLYIGAEENFTNTTSGIANQEGDTLSQTNTTTILNFSTNSEENSSGNIFYASLDSINGENSSNSSEEINNQSLIIENNSPNNINISPEISANDNQNTSDNSEIVSTENSPQESSNSESSSASVSGYTDLSNIMQNNSQNELENISSPQKEQTNYTYYLQGKKEIDVSDYNGSGITKKEFEKSEYEKEVTVSSEEHFEGYLRVYASLTTQAKKEDIKIYWKNNENLEITGNNNYSVEYYDEDNDGLIDRVSWIVPHLSEQIFDIKIELEQANLSTDLLLLNVNSPPNGIVNNPIPFNISVNYTGGAVNCSLEINQSNNRMFFEYFMVENKTIENINLQNGNYSWVVECWDSTNLSINNSTFGNFAVNESFSVSLAGGNLSSTGEKLYFLDLVKNDLKYNGTINIHSQNPSKIKIELRKDNIITYTQDIPGNITNYALPLNKIILNQSGIYNLTVYFDKPSAKNVTSVIFSVASANITFNTSQIQEGQSINIGTSVNSGAESLSYLILDYGNGTINSLPTSILTNPFSYNFLGKYFQDGQYTVKLQAYIGGIAFDIQRNGITVINGIDDTAPTINLESPDDGERIYDSAVNFSYRASDDIKIQNCTFKLYTNCASMSYCSTNSANLLFPTNAQQNSIANNYSVQNNKDVEVGLQDFTDGIYEWLVECYDNSSNYNWEIGFFQIDSNGTASTSLSTPDDNYTQKAEVEDLKAQADVFLARDFNLEEREVLDDLNILNNTQYYKKRLIDIGDFFGENYKCVSTQALLQQKTSDYLAELEDIKNKMPQNITIKDNYEYIKNSVDSDLTSIIDEYFASTNTKISKSSVQKLAKINRELQNEVSVSAKIRSVEIEYGNETQDITLVKKQIDLKNDSYNKILEVIPKNIAKSSNDITFITPNKVINSDPLFEIDYTDLDKKEITYYLTSPVKLQDFEETETLLFEDNLNKFNTRFTGFFVVDLTSGGTAIYLIIAFILLIVLSFVAIFLFKKFRMLNWRKEPNVVRVLNLIEEIKKLLKEKEIEKAREQYYKIKEIYPVLPSKTKAYFYEKINEMLVRIDRKDIFGLVKEYQEAKRNWNKEDYVRLYEDIKKIYGRLPDKDRKKVHDIINGY